MKLQTFFILVFCFVFFSCKKDEANKVDQAKISEVATLKTNLDKNKLDVQKELKNIRSNFKRINNIKSWTVIDSVELYDSTEGGQAKFYFADKQLQKIVAIYYGETGQAIEEYYLLESKLSFVFRKEFRYNRPIYWNEPNDEKFDFDKSIITEKRSYFYKDVLFEQTKSSMDNKEVINKNLDEEQESIKEKFNDLKQLSLARQI